MKCSRTVCLLVVSFIFGFVFSYAQSIPLSSPALRPSYSASVKEIIRDEVLDIVLVDAGLRQGIRVGSMCEANDKNGIFSELVIVDARENTAIALIINGKPQTELSVGDIIQVKVQK